VAYCPKCGVEVETNQKNCPLCEFSIPVIEAQSDSDDFEYVTKLQFPKPENIYPGKLIDIKKRTFFALSIFLLINAAIYVANKLFSNSLTLSTGFVTAIGFSLWIYCFVLFGLIKNRKIGIALLIINTFAFTFLIDILFNGLNWFIPVFVPATILFSVLLILLTIYMRIRRKKTINFIFPITIAISIFLIGYDAIISRWVNGTIILSWSVFASVELIGFCLLLLFFYHKMPQKMFNKLRKKMHV